MKRPILLVIVAAVAVLTIATSAQDRQLVQTCQSSGQNVTACTLKIVGR